MLESARPKVEAADKRILALLPKGKREGFIELLADLANAADAAPDLARAEVKAAKKAAKEVKRAEKLARKAVEGAVKKTAKIKKPKSVLEPVS